jgi:hypothetical protein
VKRIFTLAAATALLLVTLAAPALATTAHGPSGYASPAPFGTPKAHVGLSTKQFVSNRPKSVVGKQTLPVESGKHFDIVGK